MRLILALLMAVILRGIQQAAITSGGPTQSFPTSGHPDFSASQPVKAGIFVGGAPTATGIGSKVNNARLSFGVTDGTRHRCASIRSRNGQSLSSCVRGGFSDRLFSIYGISTTAINAQMDFSSMSSDRITGSWSTFPAGAWLLNGLLVGGSDCQAYVGSFVANATNNGTTTVDGTSDPSFGFQFDVLILFSVNRAFDGGNDLNSQFSLGIARRNLSSITNYCVSWTDLNAQTTMSLVASLKTSNGVYHHAIPIGSSDGVEITASSSSGFTATKRGTGGSTPTIAFLALKFNDVVQNALFIRGTKTSTGIDSMTEPTFPGQALVSVATLLQGVDTNDLTADAGAFGVGFSSTTDAAVTSDQSYAVHSADAVTTTNNGTLASASVNETPLDTGSTGILAAVSKFDEDGADLNYSNVLSPARGVIYLVVGRSPILGQARGTGAAAAAAAGQLVVSGTVHSGQGAASGESRAAAAGVNVAAPRAAAPAAAAVLAPAVGDESGSARASALGLANGDAVVTAGARATSSGADVAASAGAGDLSGSARAAGVDLASAPAAATVAADVAGSSSAPAAAAPVVAAAAEARAIGAAQVAAPATADVVPSGSAPGASAPSARAVIDAGSRASSPGAAPAFAAPAADVAGRAEGAGQALADALPQVVTAGVVVGDAAASGLSVAQAAASTDAAGRSSGAAQAAAAAAGSNTVAGRAAGAAQDQAQAPAGVDVLGRAPGTTAASASAPAVTDAQAAADASSEAVAAAAPLLDVVGVVTAEGAGAGSSVAAAAGSVNALGKAVASAVASALARSSADLSAAAAGSSTSAGIATLPPEVVAGFYERTSRRVRLALKAEAGALAVQFPNLPFAQPTGTWARAAVNFDEVREDVSLGAGTATYLVPGVLVVDVHVPLLTGKAAALALADSLASAMQDRQFDGVVYRMASVGPARDTGRDEFRVRFTLPFLAEDEFNRAAPTASAADDFEGAEVSIRSRFRALLPDVSVSYDNLPPATGATWVRLIVDATEAYNVDGVRREVGVVEARVHVPLNTGERDLLRLVDQVVAVFRLVDAGGVRFMVPSLGDAAEVSGQWVRSVFCPFYVDHA